VLKKLGPEIRFYCQNRRNLWCGVVSGGKPCLASEVGNRGAEIVGSLRRFFENSSYPIEPIISVIHQDEVSCYDPLGRALIHVHVHFVFSCAVAKARVPNLRRSFERRFPIGGQINPVQHIGRELSYILRTPNLRPLLISGDYVDWCRSVSGHRRINCYGGLRKAKRGWKHNRQRISRSQYFHSASSRWHERYYLEHKSAVVRRRPGGGIRVIEPNTVVGATVINGGHGRFLATILKNAQRPTAGPPPICLQYGTSKSLVVVNDTDERLGSKFYSNPLRPSISSYLRRGVLPNGDVSEVHRPSRAPFRSCDTADRTDFSKFAHAWPSPKERAMVAHPRSELANSMAWAGAGEAKRSARRRPAAPQRASTGVCRQVVMGWWSSVKHLARRARRLVWLERQE
jgi:hypothetical protein